jgi:hypothetical protein
LTDGLEKAGEAVALIEGILFIFTTTCLPPDRIKPIVYVHVLFEPPPISSIATEYIGEKIR